MSGKSEALREAAPSRFVLPKSSTGVLTEAQRQQALGHAVAFLESPTTSYFESGPLGVVRAFVEDHPGFTLEEDSYGNLIVRTPGKRRKAELAFSAHLDHPGFHYLGKRGKAHRALLVGGVPERFLAGAPVRFHDSRTLAALATAVVGKVEKNEQGGSEALLADFKGRAREGMFGVFDLPNGLLRGRRLHARVCDDLMGAAAILSVLEILAAEHHSHSVTGIFTRAEETGFVGCLGLMRSGAAKNMQVIGLECSPKRATAKPGLGPVIRAGDRMSIFDPELTLVLEDAAAAVAAGASQFRWQRALMDGGSCESTVYNAFGVRAAGACLALGNYHNCGPKGTIAPEFVDWHDYEGLIALLAQTARSLPKAEPREKILGRLNRLWEREYKLLEESTRRIQGERQS